MTVILADPVTVLPAASDTEKVTRVVPTGYAIKPSFVIFAVRSPSLLSVATAAAKNAVITSLLDRTTSPGISTLILIDSGMVNSGSTISRLTLTIVCVVPTLPTASVAVKVTVVSPNGNRSVGASLRTCRAPSTLSVAVTPASMSIISCHASG